METFNYTKPNPQYFIALLKKFNLKPEEVIMFGNNVKEDAMCAESVGIKTYLIDSDFLIVGENKNHTFPLTKMEDVIDVISKHLK